MKKTILLILANALLLCLNAQDKPNFFSFKKEKVGVQIKPYIPSLYLYNEGWCVASRFCISNGLGLSFGTEITYKYFINLPLAKGHSLFVGAYG